MSGFGGRGIAVARLECGGGGGLSAASRSQKVDAFVAIGPEHGFDALAVQGAQIA